MFAKQIKKETITKPKGEKEKERERIIYQCDMITIQCVFCFNAIAVVAVVVVGAVEV